MERLGRKPVAQAVILAVIKQTAVIIRLFLRQCSLQPRNPPDNEGEIADLVRGEVIAVAPR